MHKVLLAEPDIVLAEVTACRLLVLGCHVDTVATAEDAVRCAMSLQPDLIITDLWLGDSPAAGLIQTLCSQDATSSIPVMVLSIDADDGRAAEAQAAGACDFLALPCPLEVFHDRVRHLLDKTPAAGMLPAAGLL